MKKINLESKMKSVITASALGIAGLVGIDNSLCAADQSNAQVVSQPVGSMRARFESVNDVSTYTFALGSKLSGNASLDQFTDWLRIYDSEKSTIVGPKGKTELYGIPLAGTIFGQDSKDPSVVTGIGAEVLIGPFAKNSQLLPEGMSATLAYQNSDVASEIGAGLAFNLDPKTVFKLRFDTVDYDVNLLSKGMKDYSQMYLGLMRNLSDKDYLGIAARLTDSENIGNTFNVGYLHFNDAISVRLMGSYTSATTDKGYVDIIIAQNSTMKPGSLSALINADLINVAGALGPQLISPAVNILENIQLYDRTVEGFAASGRIGFDEKTDAVPFSGEVIYAKKFGDSRIAGGLFTSGNMHDSDVTRVGIKTGIDFVLPLERIVDQSAIRIEVGASQLLKTKDTDAFGALIYRCQF